MPENGLAEHISFTSICNCADEVAQELNCSKSHAYKLVKAMNKELDAQGYITLVGRIPKAFWAKKMYGYEIAGN